jgi:hypothetical protein
MKMVTSRSRLERKAIVQSGPIITVAEGRSRRAMKKVDYNFRSYEEQLQVLNIFLYIFYFRRQCTQLIQMQC